jgi:multidrug efflux pump subunit AcrA (membrane-fusion protein)
VYIIKNNNKKTTKKQMKTLKSFALIAITSAAILTSCGKSNTAESAQTDTTVVIDTTAIIVPTESTLVAPADSIVTNSPVL